MVLLSPRLTKRSRIRMLVLPAPGSTGATTPLPAEGIIGFERGSSTLTLLLANTCSNTRLLLSGRLSTANETGTRADLSVSEARLTLVALDERLVIEGVAAVAVPIGITNSRW